MYDRWHELHAAVVPPGDAHRGAGFDGLPVRLVELPWRTAFTEAMTAELFTRIATAAAHHPGRWVLAGHSRGAALATRYVHQYPGSMAGLILIATTHPRDVDLSAWTRPVLKIMGSHDGVAPLARARENTRLLPPSTRWLILEGGNHSRFAHYHFQLFDGRADLSREAQQAATVEGITGFLREIR